MPSTTTASSLSLPLDSSQRCARLLERLSPDLFRLLDEVAEHGGTHVRVELHRPGSDEVLKLLVAVSTVEFESA